MQLRELVWRSALRSRAAGDVEVGGLSPQVFEVADLVIPSGTDWNVTPHVIGSFTAKITDMIRWRIYLEWDSNHPLDGVSLLIGDGNSGREADLSGDGALWVQVISDPNTDQAYSLFAAPDTSAAPPAEDTFDVVLTTNPGTTEDILVTARVVVEIV